MSIPENPAARTEAMVATSLAIALSVLLHFFRIGLPHGGSITLGSMVPIWIVARRYGLRSGLMAGIGTGLVRMLLAPKILHPLQGLLDYPIAYGVLGLAAIPPSAAFGASLSCLVRYAVHVTSGVVFFGSMAPAALDPLMYSLLYNLSYWLPDMAVALGIFSLVRRTRPEMLAEPAPAESKPARPRIAGLLVVLLGFGLCAAAMWRILPAIQGMPGKTTTPLPPGTR
jgi:thiamine transporter